MARSNSSAGGASDPPKSRALSKIKFVSNLPRRQVTLISITTLLNVLFWSSVADLIISIYLIAADADDPTNIPTEILTLVSVSLLGRTTIQDR